jgi:serine/threonine protein kinase
LILLDGYNNAEMQVKLADFGLSVHAAERASSGAHGTADYMAPEQVCAPRRAWLADYYQQHPHLHVLK